MIDDLLSGYENNLVQKSNILAESPVLQITVSVIVNHDSG